MLDTLKLRLCLNIKCFYKGIFPNINKVENEVDIENEVEVHN